MFKNSKIFLTGHKGLIGSATFKKLKENDYKNIITKTRKQLDLNNKLKVENFFDIVRPDVVIICSGKSGNLYKCINQPSTLFFENIWSQNNLINSAKKYGVSRLIYIASSCVYPNITSRAIKEEDLLSNKFDMDTLTYTFVKLSGLLLCKSVNYEHFNNQNKFISIIPNTAYGPNDNFSNKNSHVFSALLKKFYDAKVKNKRSVNVFGSGKPKREFVFSEDIASAIIFLLKQKKLKYPFYNVGTNVETSIKKLAELISKKVNYNGLIKYDPSKPEGRKSKLLDSKKIINLGWKPTINIEEGLEITYDWYKRRYKNG